MRKLIAILFGAAVVGMYRFGNRSNDRSNHDERSERTKSDGEKRDADESDGHEQRRHDLQEEFMKYHETVWQKVKRNAKGLAMAADIDAAYAPGTVPSAIPGQPAEKAKP